MQSYLSRRSTPRQPQNEADPEYVLHLEDVWLKIPVRTTETRTLKSALVRSVTGGALRRSSGGAMIEALRGINCTVMHGERVALIGHNGAGKSTFLRLVAGISFPHLDCLGPAALSFR